MTREAVVQADACDGFAVSPDGSSFRLVFSGQGATHCILEMPVAGIASLMKILPEVQQIALPQSRGNASLRVIRSPSSWSLERDLSDESLALVLVTDDGFEWCFALADEEIFRMAELLREERLTTLPPVDTRQ